MAVLMTAPFVLSVVRHACTCLSSSLPSINGRPLFLSTSSFITISLPAFLFFANSTSYFVCQVCTLLSLRGRPGNALERNYMVVVTLCSAALSRAFSYRVKCSYTLRRELQAVSSSPTSVLKTFFTSSLAATMVDAGTTVDSELPGFSSTEPVHVK